MEDNTDNAFGLTLRIGTEGLSLSVCDESGLLLSSKKVAAQVQNLPAAELTSLIRRETQLNFRHIRLIFESDAYMFVPMPLFHTEDATHYLGFQHKTPKTDRVIYNTITSWNTVNVFSLPATLVQAITDLFPEQTIEHHMSSFLSGEIKPGMENSVSIWVRSKMADIIVVKEGRLQLLNSYAYQTPEDICFHALNIVEQLSLDTNQCKVFLCNNEKKTELEKLLGNYLTISSK